MAQLQLLTTKMQQMEELERARQPSPNQAESTTTARGKGKKRCWEDDWEEEEEEDTTWAKVYDAVRVTPSTSSAFTLAGIMVNPPPLSLVRTPPFESPNFISITETLSLRIHWSDQKLQKPEKKLEIAMQQLVQSLEKETPRL